MKSLSAQIWESLEVLKEKPYLADGLSGEAKKQYMDRERERVVRLHSTRLEKYLQSEEGRLVTTLFKCAWESSSGGGLMSTYKSGWIHWRVFLYKSGYHSDPNGEEIIWFGGNGLERWFREGRSNEFKTEPITPRELVMRMSLRLGETISEIPISRPEQIIPFIKMSAMDLVRYLQR